MRQANNSTGRLMKYNEAGSTVDYSINLVLSSTLFSLNAVLVSVFCCISILQFLVDVKKKKKGKKSQMISSAEKKWGRTTKKKQKKQAVSTDSLFHLKQLMFDRHHYWQKKWKQKDFFFNQATNKFPLLSIFSSSIFHLSHLSPLFLPHPKTSPNSELSAISSF